MTLVEYIRYIFGTVDTGDHKRPDISSYSSECTPLCFHFYGLIKSTVSIIRGYMLHNWILKSIENLSFCEPFCSLLANTQLY